jgi:caffeoyl-CoA O-methyltransferase
MTLAIASDQIETYLQSQVPPRPAEMQDMEEYAWRTGFPIIGPTCGYLCYQMTRISNARQVFEMGSGFGYSTAWFARGVQENGGGVVHHVVWDAELSQMARKHLKVLGYEGLIKYHISEAVQTLGTMPGQFDLIFNDINKDGYPDALPVIKEKLRPGGLLLVDNVLWSGRIFDPHDQSASTHGIRRFVEMIENDPDWIVTTIPIRDGLMIAHKKE